MTTPRSMLVDESTALHYHLVSKCVRGAWLCGKDPRTGQDYSHRKQWIEQRLHHLSRFFSVEIDAYAILSNHFHLVVLFDPLACHQWSEHEVAYRWVEAFPPMDHGVVLEDLKPLRRDQLRNDKDLLEDRRRKLGCLSTFMKHLKQPISVRANREDGCKGHFFENRFYSGALLSDEAVLASMAYVDLNPVRARIAKSLEECHNTSIGARLKHLENSLERLKEVLSPLISGTGKVSKTFEVTLAQYISLLNEVIDYELNQGSHHASAKLSRWYNQVTSFHKRQRAYGPVKALSQWIEKRGLKRLGSSLPD